MKEPSAVKRFLSSLDQFFVNTLLFGIAVLFLLRSVHKSRKRRTLEISLCCARPPTERDRFPYDFFGVAKTLELASHFQNRSSLPYTHSLFKKYGETFTSNVIGYRLIFTCNEENTKYLLATAFTDFDSSPLRKSIIEPITPHGIFTLDGPDWKMSRDQLRSRLSDLRKAIDLTLCEQHFQSFLNKVPSDGQVFDAQSCAYALALDLQTVFSLGESVDALSSTQSSEKKSFLEDLSNVKDIIVRDGFRGPLRHLSSKRQFLQSCRRTREYVIRQATKQVKKRNQMAGISKKGDAGLPEAEQISRFTDQALSLLLANDSMSTTLTSIMFCLSKDERVVKKLRASIIDTIGLTPPTWAQLGTLQYLRWVMNEAMRLFPAVVFNARVANKNTTLPTGGGEGGVSPVLIEKGEIVVFSTWSRHRLGKDFGRNLERFYPERWETLSPDMPGFIPFNKGPRACPGQHYATIIVTYIVARMFQTFSTVIDYNTKPWTERISMTFENENGVMIGLL
ncbi:cytochrome P450 oxidoreductase/alkane hydroxylase [Penicillium longicatenatum]|uniref:cytochrome P450 oxidoreductase/alkane hydroxylase n=1 Tax=Penicillium longicatenatum TaxID=1561947 RepID=UPI002548FAFB|nr:cytochrome P450 oxidoreductase/alkane hydroxylase [Penicillium longicatenatum]KAJ5640097.1 cytochrome P450 oxidoreductase/alkane hydroxylase [Penicillium longicatenatum]